MHTVFNKIDSDFMNTVLPIIYIYYWTGDIKEQYA